MNLYIQSHDYDSREKPQKELRLSSGSFGDETTVPSSGFALPDAFLSKTSTLSHFTL